MCQRVNKIQHSIDELIKLRNDENKETINREIVSLNKLQFSLEYVKLYSPKTKKEIL